MKNKIGEAIRRKADNMLDENIAIWNKLAFKLKADVTIEYEIQTKFLSNVYGMFFKLNIYDLKLSKSFSCTSKFIGGFKATGIVFIESKNSNCNLDFLNSDIKLLKLIMEASKKVDFERIYIKYDQKKDVLNITIKPYAGSYIWVKFPPIQKRINLRKEEIEVIYLLIKVLNNYFKPEASKFRCRKTLMSAQSYRTFPEIHRWNLNL